MPSSFQPGLKGLSEAIRAWKKRPYKTVSDEWSVDRFANIIGNRLVAVARNGRARDAESALGSLARVAEYSEKNILSKTAALLEEQGEPRLATIAYTLVWFQTRRYGENEGCVVFAQSKRTRPRACPRSYR